MQWMARALACLVVLAAGMGNAQQSPRRVALVIGNAAYTTPGWKLINPVNDATLIASRLRGLGFEVDPVMNATKAQMESAFQRFGDRLKTAGPGAVGVFYYAGHGAQKDGINLLVPVDVTARTMDQLRYQAPAMQFLLDDMAEAGNPVNIIILDACRNVPLLDSARAGPGRGGLAELTQAPPDVLIAYSTRGGYTAPDNPGDTNSIFTRTLADALVDQAGDRISTLFDDVNARVYDATGGAQRPEYRTGLVRAPRWSLRPAVVAPPTVVAPPRVTTPAVAAPPPQVAAASRPTFRSIGPGAPGAKFKECEDCPEMTVLPAGAFNMGSTLPNESPVRRVTVRSFALGLYEVTRHEFAACMADGGCGATASYSMREGVGDRRPVINQTWNRAKGYVAWLAQKTGKPYRLPTEAEWEYAAHAGTSTTYTWGNDGAAACTAGAFEACGALASRPDRPEKRWQWSLVGRYPPNAFGIFDLYGNVTEVVEDCYVSYATAPTDGSAATSPNCASYSVRGASDAAYVERMRPASRSALPPNDGGNSNGFRVARSLN